MNGLCDSYLLGTYQRCGEPAAFTAVNRKHLPEATTSEHCFFHSVKLAAVELEDGRPEFRIVAL